MKVDILTLFPEMFTGVFTSSIIKRAQDKKLVEMKCHNIRNWAMDKHKTVDDRPYGGGPGMILKVDVIDRALNDVIQQASNISNPENVRGKTKVVLLDARGKTYDQEEALMLSKMDHLVLIAGHYEGVDHRVQEHLADEVISIGPYVLSGGEIPAMAIVDSVVRLIPGVIDPESLKEESFNIMDSTKNKVHGKKPKANIEYPQYTRPEVYKGWKVPNILLSGNHKDISQWRSKKQKPSKFQDLG